MGTTPTKPLEEYVGKTFKIVSGTFKGQTFEAEGTAQQLLGCPWMVSGRPVAFDYLMRIKDDGLPMDNDVLCGKIGYMSKIIHVSQLGEECT